MGLILKLLKYYISICYWNRQPVEKVKAMQLKKFKAVFEYAREHSAFYRDLYTKAGVMNLEIKSWDDVAKVPIVDKQMMRRYTTQDTLTCNMADNDIVRCATSGSTGEPFNLAYSKFANLSAYLRVFYIMRKTVGYNPFKRMVLLSKYEVGEVFKLEKNLSLLKQMQNKLGIFSRKIISIFESPDEMVRKLLEYKPFVLYSSSSAVEIVADYALEHNISVKIPNIVLIAEPLSMVQYKKFVKCFGARIVDIYGAKESPSLGYEVNKEGVFHLFPNSNCFEFINHTESEDGVLHGTTVITNLINKVQPFVRYNLNDYAEIALSPDFGVKDIGPIIGRVSDILKFPDGKSLFHYCISQLFIDFGEAKQYKFLQIDDGPIEMQILKKPEFDNVVVKNEALRRWNKSYSSYPLRIVFVDKFDIDKKTGKFKVIEKRISNGD